MAGEELGLEMRKKADLAFFFEVGMGDLLLFALLPGGEEGLAGGVGHGDGPAGGVVEVLGLDLPTIDEREDEPVGEEGAELFHEVEGEGRAAGAQRMQITDLWIEADAFEGGSAVVHEQGVGEGEHGVDGIGGRAPVAAGEGEGLFIHGYKLGEGGEVGGGGFAFVAAQLIDGHGGFQAAEILGEPRFGLFQWIVFAVVAQGAAQDGAGVGEFADEHVAGDGRSGVGVVRDSVLSAPQQHVAGDGPLDAGEELAVLGEEGDGNITFGAVVHQERTHGDGAETDDAVERVDGYAQAGLLFDVDDDRLPFFVKVGVLGGDIEGVKVFLHSSLRSISNLRSEISDSASAM